MRFDRLKTLRTYEDMSQREVAKLIRCHPNTYSKYERGIWEIPLDKALIIAKFHNVSIDYLLGISSVKGSYSIKNIELTKRMKFLRKQNSYTQKTLAQKLYCRPETYQRYELGYEDTPISIIIALSKLYSVSSDLLIGSDDIV